MSQILIIGATSAIAQSVARLYAESGARMFLVGRDASRLDSVADDLRVRGAIAVDCLAADLTEHDRHPEIVAAAFDALSGLDTVLVAHNAAFDMRFLELKEAATGVRFAQPVLDTLLLSAIVHPNQESHSLEAVAERLGVSVIGRHTALGDALVTGEIFLKLLPLLAEHGIATLSQALEASRKTYHARLQY